MTEPAKAAPEGPPPLNVTALLAEALAKSSVCWVETEERSRALWYAVLDGAVLIVTGAGEQQLPDLPEQVRLVLRSKDSGGRLLQVDAAARVVTAEDSGWEAAAAALAAERLNATDDQLARWRESGTIYELRPFGQPRQGPGSYAEQSGAAPVTPARGTTAGWRPRHLGGRGRRPRRG
ncbi:MAG: hypothetical protein V9G19_13435 [Tetrasphaera sp.]